MLEVVEIRCFPPQLIQRGTRKVQITQIKECNKETLRKALREQFMKMLVERSGKDGRNRTYKGLDKKIGFDAFLLLYTGTTFGEVETLRTHSMNTKTFFHYIESVFPL